jgi:hypothetical protein
VACFLAGFFETMIDYMSQDAYKNLAAWQTSLLYSNENLAPRQQFWEAVLTKALKLLSDNTKLYQKWLRINESDSPPTNAQIATALANLLREPIRAFFSHSVTKEHLRQIKHKSIDVKGSTSRIRNPQIPFLFIVDEAAFLYQTNYMHTFMWVLDQPVVHILTELYNPELDSTGLSEMPTDHFFVLMLGTHSQISHFAPNQIFPSERYLGQPQLLPSPFLSFNWDEHVKVSSPPFKLRDSESLFELASWGRSMWGALFEQHLTTSALWDLIQFVKGKLSPGSEDKLQKILSKLAVMSIRLHLDLDCASPTRASQLVCSKMRWLADVGIFRTHVTTTYGSEPLLVEGAACLMNSYGNKNNPSTRPPYVAYVEELLSQLTKGYISRGDHGELTARLLRMFFAYTI